MVITCPRCKAKLESDEPLYGMEVECTNCGKTFIVPKAIKLKVSKFNWPCYFLGVFLGFLGVIIAQMTDGTAGVKSALRGLVIHIALVAGLTFVLTSYRITIF